MHTGQLFPAVCFWKNLIPDAVKYWFSLTSVKALIFLLRLNNLSNKIFLCLFGLPKMISHAHLNPPSPPPPFYRCTISLGPHLLPRSTIWMPGTGWVLGWWRGPNWQIYSLIQVLKNQVLSHRFSLYWKHCTLQYRQIKTKNLPINAQKLLLLRDGEILNLGRTYLIINHFWVWLSSYESNIS